MDSLVLRPALGPWRLGLNFLVGTFAVALLTMCAYGADEPPFDTSVVNIGPSVFAFVAILTTLAVRNYFAATLRLSSEDFEIGKHKMAWTDVAAYETCCSTDAGAATSRHTARPDFASVVPGPAHRHETVDTYG